MQECEFGDSQSSNASMDLSDMFLEILSNAKSQLPSPESNEQPVCLPSARSYKEIIDENLRLHSMILNIKVENEKLSFVNNRISTELADVNSSVAAKKSKYKSVLSQKDLIIADLQKKLEDDLFSLRRSIECKADSEKTAFKDRLTELQNCLDESTIQRDAAINDLKHIQSELAQSQELISSINEELTRIKDDNSSLRTRLSMFGIPAPQTSVTPAEPHEILLLSKFSQIHTT